MKIRKETCPIIPYFLFFDSLARPKPLKVHNNMVQKVDSKLTPIPLAPRFYELIGNTSPNLPMENAVKAQIVGPDLPQIGMRARPEIRAPQTFHIRLILGVSRRVDNVQQGGSAIEMRSDSNATDTLLFGEKVYKKRSRGTGRESRKRV